MRFALPLPAGSGLRRAPALPVVLVGALALAGCESSSRLGSLLPGGGSAAASPNVAPAPPPLTAAPAGTVESTALPPPPGTQAAGGLGAPGNVPPAPPAVDPNAPAPGSLPAPRTAAVTPPAVPAAPAAPTRSAVTGNWTLVEANGARCRATLSSVPKLDRYGAGTSGCQAKELQRVNAWELNGNEVLLYEPGGGVVARLRQTGGQSFSGASTRSGAPLTLSK